MDTCICMSLSVLFSHRTASMDFSEVYYKLTLTVFWYLCKCFVFSCVSVLYVYVLRFVWVIKVLPDLISWLRSLNFRWQLSTFVRRSSLSLALMFVLRLVQVCLVLCKPVFRFVKVFCQFVQVFFYWYKLANSLFFILVFSWIWMHHARCRSLSGRLVSPNELALHCCSLTVTGSVYDFFYQGFKGLLILFMILN